MSALLFKFKFAFGKALSGLKQARTGMRNLWQEGRKAQKNLRGNIVKSKVDLKAWGDAFKDINGVVGGFFSRMIANSPVLGLAFAELGFKVDLLAMSIGDNLAPLLEPLFTALGTLIDWVRGLPEPFQQFIGVVIALTLAFTLLIPVIIGLQVAASPVILIILAVIIAIAALILIILWLKNNFKSLTERLAKFKIVLAVLTGMFLILIFPLLAIVAGVILLIAIWKKFGGLIKAFGSTILSGFVRLFTGGFSLIGGVFHTILDGIMRAITGFTGWFADRIAWLVDKLLAGVKKLQEAWEKAKNLGGSAKDAATGLGSTIKSGLGFEKGGLVPTTGFHFLHAGERVLNVRETQSLAVGGVGASGGGGGLRAILAALQNKPTEISTEVNIDGGIFTSEGAINELADLISEMIVEKTLRGSNA